MIGLLLEWNVHPRSCGAWLATRCLLQIPCVQDPAAPFLVFAPVETRFRDGRLLCLR